MSEPTARRLRVLLLGPVEGRDPLSGDTSYTAALLAAPPDLVDYVSYPDALASGELVVRGRRPKHGSGGSVDRALLVARGTERVLRGRLMFREPTWFVSSRPGAFDLIHAHLFPVRQIGSHRVPVVSSAGFPLTELYRSREGWSSGRLQRAERLERWWATSLCIHDPWLRCNPDSVMTVYSQHFRRHLVGGGVPGRSVMIAGTALPDHTTRSVGDEARPFTVAFIGRDFERKGGPAAFDAFALLATRHPSWRFVLVSDGAGGRLDPRVTVLPSLPRERLLEEVLDGLDVLVLPTSLDCGVPFTVLEALQRGAGVVIGPSPWLDDRLGGPSVRRVAVSPVSIASAIEALAEVPHEERVAASERLSREQLSMASLHAALDRAYGRVVSGPEPRAAGDESDRPRVLVVGRTKELSDAPFDGFAMRQSALVRALRTRFDLAVATVDLAGEPGTTTGGVDPRPVLSLVLPRRPDARLDRLAQMRNGLRESALESWERELVAAATDVDPDVVVTFGPWLDDEYRALFDRWPTIHFYEEDLSRMPELAPQSRQARVLRAASVRALGRRRAQPRVVIAISPPELERARTWAPRAEAVLVPLTLDPTSWPIAEEPSSGDTVMVIGNLSEARNAEGLASVLGRVRDRGLGEQLRFRLVTASGVHSSIEPFLGLSWVDAGPERGSVQAEYRASMAALVPAFRASGMKTTIIQAWASGCPVVTTPVCAGGVGAHHGEALLIGATADELVDQILRLRREPEERVRLVKSARGRLVTDFDRARQDEHVIGLVTALERGAR